VYEGDDGPGLKQLLQDKVLPVAAQQGDRWLAHWAFDMIGRRDLAMRCLAGSLTDIVDVKLTPAQIQEASHFRNSDPALLFYYRQLRDLVVPPGQDPYPALEPAEEWDFIMRTVRTYMRAGCAALALTIGTVPILSLPLRPNTQLQLTSRSSHMALPSTQHLIRTTNQHQASSTELYYIYTKTSSQAISPRCLPRSATPTSHYALRTTIYARSVHDGITSNAYLTTTTKPARTLPAGAKQGCAFYSRLLCRHSHASEAAGKPARPREGISAIHARRLHGPTIEDKWHSPAVNARRFHGSAIEDKWHKWHKQ